MELVNARTRKGERLTHLYVMCGREMTEVGHAYAGDIIVVPKICLLYTSYRSGLQSISRGQFEAAEVLGYSKAQTYLHIVFPQVAKRIMPAVGNEVITLVKDTSLSFAIGVGEMFSTAKALVASQVSMVPFAIAAAIYWLFNCLVELALGAIEKKLSYYSD